MLRLPLSWLNDDPLTVSTLLGRGRTVLGTD